MQRSVVEENSRQSVVRLDGGQEGQLATFGIRIKLSGKLRTEISWQHFT